MMSETKASPTSRSHELSTAITTTSSVGATFEAKSVAPQNASKTARQSVFLLPAPRPGSPTYFVFAATELRRADGDTDGDRHRFDNDLPGDLVGGHPRRDASQQKQAAAAMMNPSPNSSTESIATPPSRPSAQAPKRL